MKSKIDIEDIQEHIISAKRYKSRNNDYKYNNIF